MLGAPDAWTDGADQVFRYADVEIHVAGRTGAVRTIRLESSGAVTRLPPGLVAGGVEVRLPEDRERSAGRREGRGVGLRAEEGHVPGRAEIVIHLSPILPAFREDGAYAGRSVSGEPR